MEVLSRAGTFPPIFKTTENPSNALYAVTDCVGTCILSLIREGAMSLPAGSLALANLANNIFGENAFSSYLTEHFGPVSKEIEPAYMMVVALTLFYLSHDLSAIGRAWNIGDKINSMVRKEIIK